MNFNFIEDCAPKEESINHKLLQCPRYRAIVQVRTSVLKIRAVIDSIELLCYAITNFS